MKRAFSLGRYAACGVAALLFAVAAVAPASATPVTISFSGQVDQSYGTIFGDSSFDAGDILMGVLEADVGPFGAFDKDDLQSFNLTIGNDSFGLSDIDDGFIGTTGNDASDFSLLFNAGLITFAFSGNDGQFATFKVLGLAGGSYGTFTLDSMPQAVPEPAEIGMFGFGLLMIVGFAAMRRRHGNKGDGNPGVA